MWAAIMISIVLGLGWNLIAILLMGGTYEQAWEPVYCVAGAVAGLSAGIYTIWTGRRTETAAGNILFSILTFYVGIFTYWAMETAIAHAIHFYSGGGLMGSNFNEDLKMLGVFLIYGTAGYGIYLFPLCFFFAVAGLGGV